MYYDINHKFLLEEEIYNLSKNSQFDKTKLYKQHGKTSVYEHSINVAYTSLLIAEKMSIKTDFRSLVRGALLHDYFLYDWHVPEKTHMLHGFTHPRKALENALAEVDLNNREKDIILKHMFPLTPVPPRYAESWIVTAADKICSVMETLNFKQTIKKDSAAGDKT
ncbi:HD domain-containing protein [Lachnospiraceae bacterium NSJ-143]|nr:HD domain-containing protein [Lachnospiraceae bacterium NSJ-143]